MSYTVEDGKIFIDGKECPDLMLRGAAPPPGIFDQIAANKKKIMGFFGGVMQVAVLVVLSNPGEFAQYHHAVVIFLGVAAALGYTGAHASGPDKPAPPVAPVSTSLTTRGLSSPITPKE